MRKFLVKSHTSDLEIVFEYGATGSLIGFSLNKEVPKEDFVRISLLVEKVQNYQELQHLYRKFPKLVVELKDTPTFDDFWETYNYKVDRKRAEEKWGKLKDNDKTRALGFIKSYESERAQTGAAKMYAKTYLTNQIWK